MTVYVTQQPTPNRRNWQPDLSPAAEYGKIKYIFQGGEQPFTNPANAISVARKELRDFNPETDFICWPNSGDPASLYATIMCLVDKGHKEITFLYWNRNRDANGQPLPDRGYYAPVKMSL